MNPTAVKWMLCSAVVPVGFYIGLSARESSEERAREEKRTEALVQRRVRALLQEAEREEHGQEGKGASTIGGGPTHPA